MKLHFFIFTSLFSLSLANTNTEYVQLFNDLLNDESSSPPGHEIEYYCVRNYVKTSELTDYNIKVNPKQINVLSVDCAAQIELAKNDAATVLAGDKGLNKEQKDCVKKTFLEGNYFNAMAIVVALGQLTELTRGQILEEQKKFVDTMKRMTEECNKCFENNKKTEKKSDKESEKEGKKER